MAGIILSVDIGTSSIKTAFIDLDGKLIAFSRAAYGRPSSGANAPAAIADEGAAAWERALTLALGELHSLAPLCVCDGVCVSGNGPTLVPVTREGKTLPPLYWNDGRTVLKREGQSKPEPPSFFLPHAAWLKQNAPVEYENLRFFFSSHEWLSHRLGADAFTALPQAAYEPYYWDDEQCRLFGLERSKFPPFVEMGSSVGRVSAEAASFFGAGKFLKEGTPIIAGAPDFISALIGTAVQKPGETCDRAGSSEGINVCADAPVKGDGLRTLPHFREGLWNIGALIPSSGRLFDRYRQLSGQEARPYGELLEELIPYSSFLTPPSSFLLPPSSLAFGRSVICSIGLAVREALKTLEHAGLIVKEMRVSGGQGKNRLWNQLKADMSGVSLMVPEIPDAELAGNTVLAAVALGEASCVEDAASRMIHFRDVYEPRKETGSFWEEEFEKFRTQRRQGAKP